MIITPISEHYGFRWDMTLELERIQRNQKAAPVPGTVRKYIVLKTAKPQDHRNKAGKNWTKPKARGKTLWAKNSELFHTITQRAGYSRLLHTGQQDLGNKDVQVGRRSTFYWHNNKPSGTSVRQKQVGKLVQKESGRPFCLLYPGPESQQKLRTAAGQLSHLQILSLQHSCQ